MTEEEWLESGDPIRMLLHLESAGGTRDLMLTSFCTACVHTLQHSYDEMRVRVLQLLSRLATVNEFVAARKISEFAAAATADLASQACGISPSQPVWWDLKQRAFKDQSDMLRDIIGNPFRNAAISDSWRTAAVVAIATAIDMERRVDLMPALGAALSDAGCTETTILEHCGRGPHVKGCWVVDLLLRKEATA